MRRGPVLGVGLENSTLIAVAGGWKSLGVELGSFALTVVVGVAWI